MMQDDLSATPPANDFFPPFSASEMLSRRQRAQAGMAERGLDCLVVWGAVGYNTSPGQLNLSWLANYASVGQCYLVLPQEGAPTLVLGVVPHARNARMLTHGLDIRTGPSIVDTLVERLREAAPRRVGLASSYSALAGVTVPVTHMSAMQAACPQADFDDVTEWLEDLQMLKSDEELALLRRAGRLGDEVFAQLLQATHPGVTDTALRRLIARACVDAGATHPFSHIGSFSTADPEDLYPDFYPTADAVRAGDLLQTELCLGYGNYWNKIWGTWFVGRPPVDYLEMQSLAKDTHDAVISALRPGLPCAEFQRFAQPLIDRGYTLHMPLVMGWSKLNHGPWAGTEPGTRWHQRAERYREAAFEPRQTLTVLTWLARPGTRRGLWVGSSGAITDNGFERFNSDVGTRLNIV